LEDDTDELLGAYRKLAKAANKRVKEEGDDLGIYLTKWGLIWHTGESS
jgi:proline dehydrogenase